MTSFLVDIEIYKDTLDQSGERILSSHITKSVVKIFDKSTLNMPSKYKSLREQLLTISSFTPPFNTIESICIILYQLSLILTALLHIA